MAAQEAGEKDAATEDDQVRDLREPDAEAGDGGGALVWREEAVTHAGTRPLVRRRVHITGRVQGVYFRDSTRREAIRRGIAGWVCNRPDGSVEAALEGPVSAVEELLEWCRVGPPAARVVAVEHDREEPLGEVGFSIR
jgi:acylphosphatase